MVPLGWYGAATFWNPCPGTKLGTCAWSGAVTFWNPCPGVKFGIGAGAWTWSVDSTAIIKSVLIDYTTTLSEYHHKVDIAQSIPDNDFIPDSIPGNDYWV